MLMISYLKMVVIFTLTCVLAFSATISDERLKDDVKTIEFALDKINNLKGVWNVFGTEVVEKVRKI